jgi:hypothetical protein
MKDNLPAALADSAPKTLACQANAAALAALAAEAASAGFARNFIGLVDPAELKAALVAADEAGESWPAPGWLESASPAAMRGVATGWATWRDPAPDGAVELRSDEEQRVACGNRWFLFPE